MAKQIKAIKCPQCGSTEKTELRPDYFRCNNCNTEYFLDNDDLTVHHKVTAENKPAITPENTKKLVRLIWILIAGIFIILFAVLWLKPKKTTSPRFSTQSKEEAFSIWSSTKAAYISAEGKPIEVIVSNRNYRGGADESKNGNYLSFYDLQTGKEIKTEKQPVISPNGEDYKSATFKNGDVYFIAGTATILKLDKNALSLTDVTQSLFAQHGELTSGIAKAAFIDERFGDGFDLMTNDGANYFYYPLVDKVYTKKGKLDAENALAQVRAGMPLADGFIFSAESADYPEEKVQLIKYTRPTATGGPDDMVTLRWHNNHYTGAKSFYPFGKGIVQSWRDFTPGRQYSRPEVLYWDKELVLIFFANTPAEKSAKSLQCLNAETGEIIFTLPLGSNYQRGGVLRYKDGFVIKNGNTTLLVSTAGKLLTEFKTGGQ